MLPPPDPTSREAVILTALRPPTLPRVRAQLPLVLALAVVAVLAPATGVAAGVPADLVPPATIRVCTDGGPVTVAFDEYVKWVVPYEFGENGADAYLQAGAVAVRSFAWYHVEHPTTAECDVFDDGRHQHYIPGNSQRDARTDALVDASWHLRLEERGAPAFAQYCSRSCDSFTPGRHLDQFVAMEQAANGWSAADILAHHYRALEDYALVDWRQGFGLTWDGRAPYALESNADPQVSISLSGVSPGDARAEVGLFAVCTIEGGLAAHHVQTAPVGDVDGRAIATFDRTARLHDCAEREFHLFALLTINGWQVAAGRSEVWRPWRSAAPREVERLAATDDPVAAAIELSRVLFDDHVGRPSGEDGGEVTGMLLPPERETDDGTADDGTVDAVVLTRSDKYPDALAAAALAGTEAPILLNPGGPDSRLDERVRTEIDRLLGGQGTVHLVGGPAALSEHVARSLQDAGYTVARHGGDDRVATAVAVADAVIADGGDASTVLLARAFPDGTAGWADAIAVGSYAAASRHPVLLTRPEALAPGVEAWIEGGGNGVAEVLVLGGPVAVSPAAAGAIDGARVTRVAGAVRDDTAVAIAEQLWSRSDAPPVRAALIDDIFRPGAWSFALAASVYGATVGAPQLGVTTLVPATSTGRWLDAHQGLPAVVVGGHGVVASRIDGDLAGG
ncbi:MAG: cell wall-binding repeat-containing protein [Actinobacteria bacterium]|nr:cell wall-binding repeat-containing protein [Actinomycetota bacterium]